MFQQEEFIISLFMLPLPASTAVGLLRTYGLE